MPRTVKTVALSVALAGALVLPAGNAAAGGGHYHYHGHHGPYGTFHPGFGHGLGVRYSGIYYYAPPPIYYADPAECGWDYVRIWRYGYWRAKRVWRCW